MFVTASQVLASQDAEETPAGSAPAAPADDAHAEDGGAAPAPLLTAGARVRLANMGAEQYNGRVGVVVEPPEGEGDERRDGRVYVLLDGDETIVRVPRDKAVPCADGPDATPPSHTPRATPAGHARSRSRGAEPAGAPPWDQIEADADEAFGTPSRRRRDEPEYSHLDDDDVQERLRRGGLLGAGLRSKRVRTEAGPPQLSSLQQRAVQAAESGRNVFITGPAGVGKSHCLSAVVDALKKQGKRVQLTASSGIAAVLIGGRTLHSFAGVGIAEESAIELANKVCKRKPTVERLQSIDVLVIDEVSMLAAELIDKLDFVFRRARDTAGRINGDPLDRKGHPDPFGGLQVIFVGDFFQLPPVEKGGGDPSYAFEADAWGKLDPVFVELTEVFRQTNREFVEILNSIRCAEFDAATVTRFMNSMKRPVMTDDGILPTLIYPMRKDVRKENDYYFQKLQGEPVLYTAQDFASGTNDGDKWFKVLNEDLQLVKHLQVKKGMQVMLLTNMDTDAGLCNGSRGVVVGFTSKSNLDFKDKQIGPRVHEWLEKHDAVPIVHFANGVRVAIPPISLERKTARGVVELERAQMPLAPAWALTVHKCQGLSLDRVRMQLQMAFGDGMVYVALSRARDESQTEIMGYHLSKIKANNRVKIFYRRQREKQEAAARVQTQPGPSTAAEPEPQPRPPTAEQPQPGPSTGDQPQPTAADEPGPGPAERSQPGPTPPGDFPHGPRSGPTPMDTEGTPTGATATPGVAAATAPQPHRPLITDAERVNLVRTLADKMREMVYKAARRDNHSGSPAYKHLAEVNTEFASINAEAFQMACDAITRAGV